MNNSSIDTEKASNRLRQQAIDLSGKRVSITSFIESKQKSDLTIPANCNGFGRIHHFRRIDPEGWPLNPLPLDPASISLNLPFEDLMQVQLFQNSVCSWRCWYCFVDYKLLNGIPKYSKFLSASDLIDFYERETIQPRIIDISGGQPDLVPEWGLWMLTEIEKRRNLKPVYLWSDDNLSNDYLWRYLSKDEIRRLACSKYYGRVGCFKGFDTDSFMFNTRARKEDFFHQFELMKRIVEAGFDVYGYATFTANNDNNLLGRMTDFIDMLQEKVNPIFPLRTIPLRIKYFTPMTSRMSKEHERALKIQWLAVQIWTDELKRRYGLGKIGKRIFEHIIK